MKKKFFASLAAAAMLCCTLAAPVSAAETYKRGDINMDGEVDVVDAMLAIQEYVNVYVAENEAYLTPEQLALANVVLRDSNDNEYQYLLQNAVIIFVYSVECIAHPAYTEMEIADWYPQWLEAR